MLIIIMKVPELHGLARRFALSYEHANQKLQDALIALLRGHDSLAAQRAALKRAFAVARIQLLFENMRLDWMI